MSSASNESPPLNADDESFDAASDTNQTAHAEQDTPPSDNDETIEDNNPRSNKRLWSIILLQIFLILMLSAVGFTYSRMHHLPNLYEFALNPNAVDYSEAIRNFNFIGVGPDNPEPSLIAVIYEVFILSFAGVLARQLYYLTQIAVRGRDFTVLKLVSKLIGDSAMGVAIAIAVVAFLRSTEFVNLTLRTADIGAIMAISFILGFYHEDTRRLLGSFRDRISGTVRETDEDGDIG